MFSQHYKGAAPEAPAHPTTGHRDCNKRQAHQRHGLQAQQVEDQQHRPCQLHVYHQEERHLFSTGQDGAANAAYSAEQRSNVMKVNLPALPSPSPAPPSPSPRPQSPSPTPNSPRPPTPSPPPSPSPQCPLPSGPYRDFCQGCRYDCTTHRLTCDYCRCHCEKHRGSPLQPRRSEVPSHWYPYFFGKGHKWCICRYVLMSLKQACKSAASGSGADLSSVVDVLASAELLYVDNALQCRL